MLAAGGHKGYDCLLIDWSYGYVYCRFYEVLFFRVKGGVAVDGSARVVFCGIVWASWLYI